MVSPSGGIVSPKAARSSGAYERSTRRPWRGITASARPKCPPAGSDSEVIAGHVASICLGRDGDGRDLRAQGSLGDARHRCVRVEQSGKYSPPGRRFRQRIRCSFGVTIWPARKRNARPFHTERAGIDLVVDRIVQDGERVVEQIIRGRANTAKITLCRR